MGFVCAGIRSILSPRYRLRRADLAAFFYSLGRPGGSAQDPVPVTLGQNRTGFVTRGSRLRETADAMYSSAPQQSGCFGVSLAEHAGATDVTDPFLSIFSL